MKMHLVAVILLVICLGVEIQGKDKPRQARKPQRTWSKWLRCTVSCGKGWQSRLCLKDRSSCNGRMAQRRMCNVHPCPVPEDGSWSAWQPYADCERSSTDYKCMGIQESIRLCNSPAPQPGGKYCTGCETRVKPCSLC
ncbi:thrombospondin-2-like [Mizuhopecten yessoensis]|uniref:Hemicentin-1 n=1 Tax=Mizuhopecten yessoensis TaxID=6573 RepID=A0A210PY73_MIZYE|nr:thrombospondin-2-like [Mizuhopecten yessoensis]XP_021372159.1 thrombospondin-2-like [Mizuhopecten yessoensis]OWF41424.1 Hemicentin-1 [Mizuhopecten yessoensis]